MLERGDFLPGDDFWQAFLAEERLPATYRDFAIEWFMPLVAALLDRRGADSTVGADFPVEVVGLYGCQGSGKSTLGALLAAWLGEVAGLQVLSLSLDDFYLPLAQREELARDVHPLFATRGVPGTHEMAALGRVIEAVRGGAGPRLTIPQFDKATDDRAAPGIEIDPERVDLIVLEGWCVGLPPQPRDQLREPINDLEGEEDRFGVWRGAVNNALEESYREVFDLIDTQVVLKAPSFDSVFSWRWEQEEKLRSRVADSLCAGQGLMDEAALARFLQFYQRLTEWGLESMPARADLCFHLQGDRSIRKVSGDMARYY